VPFIEVVERKESELNFMRIDAELNDAVIDEADDADFAPLIGLFKACLDVEDVEIEAKALKDAEIPAIILVSEDSRRMAHMMKIYGGMFSPADTSSGEKLVINKNNEAVKKLLGADENDEKAKLAVRFIYDVARLSHKQLDAEALDGFVARSNALLNELL